MHFIECNTCGLLGHCSIVIWDKKDCYALPHEILVKHYYAENPTVYWHVILNITVKINVIFDYDCNDNPFITG